MTTLRTIERTSCVRVWRCGKFALAALIVLTISPVFAEDSNEQLFVRRIQPLLNEKCWACHGNNVDDINGNLNLKSIEMLIKGGDSGMPAVVRGNPDQSPLYLVTLREHEEWSAMPPKEADKLSAEQRKWMRDWIIGGAAWPNAERIKVITAANANKWAATDGAIVKTSGGLSDEWTNRRYKSEGLWAYQPLSRPAIPRSPETANGTHPIDYLISIKMPDGLQPAQSVDAGTFIRRAAFDLTGLPPRPEDVVTFETAFADDAESAITALIEQLLASPHYGERMAQHWLDVTRYADSSGFANDYERGNAWRYRDYVIRAFNNDKPYDQFIKEQIAGDEIDSNNPEMLIATGFLRMGPWELTGMEVARIARQRFLDDVTNSVGETFLAHSLQCARCHDHKFDPVPTKDYYSIQAVFATTQLAERPAPFLPEENTAGFDERIYLQKTREEHSNTLRALDNVLLENARKWLLENNVDPTPWNTAVAAVHGDHNNSARKTNNKRQESTVVFLAARKQLQSQKVPETEIPPKNIGFTPNEFGRERVARKGLERLNWVFDRYQPIALSVYAGLTPSLKSVNSPMRMPATPLSTGELDRSCILVGGDPFAEGPEVSPGTLSVIDTDRRQPISEGIEGRRRAFSDWIASKNNPLTTRTIVNRVWMWHFGSGLAGNPNNFGSTGKQPTHPELLDWLAAELVSNNWSIKALHRSIMTSKAYRRSTRHFDPELLQQKDPMASSYAVFQPRRLSAEELRDAMLAASGELNPTVGGIPNRPEINPEVASQPRQVMGSFASAWVPNTTPQQRHRRSIYALKLRGLGDPAMEVFNSPSPDFSCERRETSNVTPQVFAMFNSEASHSRALALAARASRETTTDEAAISRCFKLVYSREARPEELSICLTHWRKIESKFGDSVPVMSQPPLEVLREAVEENTGEKFVLRETLHANADFVPDLQPGDVSAHVRALADICLALFNSNEFAYVY